MASESDGGPHPLDPFSFHEVRVARHLKRGRKEI